MSKFLQCLLATALLIGSQCLALTNPGTDGSDGALVFQVTLPLLPSDGVKSLYAMCSEAEKKTLELLMESQPQSVQGVLGMFVDGSGNQEEGGAVIIDFTRALPAEQVPDMLGHVSSGVQPLGDGSYALGNGVVASLSNEGHLLDIRTCNLPKNSGTLPDLPPEAVSFEHSGKILQICWKMTSLNDEGTSLPMQGLLYVLPDEINLQIRETSPEVATNYFLMLHFFLKALHNLAEIEELPAAFLSMVANSQLDLSGPVVKAVWKGDAREMLAGAMQLIAEMGWEKFCELPSDCMKRYFELFEGPLPPKDMALADSLQQVMRAFEEYANDHAGVLPSVNDWQNELTVYLEGKKMRCTANERMFQYFGEGKKLDRYSPGAERTVICMCASSQPDKWFIGFANGHVAMFDVNQVRAILAPDKIGDCPKW